MNPAIVTVNVAAYGFADRISLIRIGILAHRSRARVDQRQLAPRSPLSIAQQSPREFLTEARPSVSVKGYGAKTIHVVVVDPDVGTERRPLLVSAQNQYFVAPDNGVLSIVYEREKDSLVVRHANVEHYYLQPVSKTFHGRDIFAPVASWLSKGWQTPSMGDEISDYKRFSIPRPKDADGTLKGTVLRTDGFGNLITNFRSEDLPESAVNGGAIQLQVGTHQVSRLVETFAHGNNGEPIAYLGSSGYLEIAVNKASAARALNLGRGTPVILTK